MSPRENRQCAHCPWKVGSDTAKIPGYVEAQHHALRGTIAEPGSLRSVGEPELRVMACHDSPEDAPRVCVGWAHHQLGVGDNIALRIRAWRDESLQNLRVEGPQHETFEATLPRRSGGAS